MKNEMGELSQLPAFGWAMSSAWKNVGMTIQCLEECWSTTMLAAIVVSDFVNNKINK